MASTPNELHIKARIEGLDAKIAELREATREANETLKDIKQARKDAAAELLTASAEIAETVRYRIDTRVNEGLEQYKDALFVQIEKAEKAIIDRFETLSGLLVGEKANDLLTQHVAEIRKRRGHVDG